MTLIDPLTLAKPQRLTAGGNVYTVDLLKSIAKAIRLTIGEPDGRPNDLRRLARQIERLASTMDAEAS